MRYYFSSIPPITLSGSNALRYLNLTDSKLPAYLTNPLVIIKDNASYPYPVNINLGSNCIKDIQPEVFQHMLDQHLLESLDLSHCCFGSESSIIYLADPAKEFLHEGFKTLLKLDLSYNSIASLPANIFFNLRGIKILSLGGNYLREVNFSIINLHNLTYLGLDKNLISYLDIETRNAFDSMKHNWTLNLAGNPLVCTCESLHFIKWVFQTHIDIKNLDETYCSYKDGLVSLSDIKNEELAKLEKRCRSNVYIMWSAISLCVVIIVLGIMICLYRHRWDVKYFCLNLISDRKAAQRIEDGKVYAFDAFVAFHQDDIYWVKTQLLANLEEPKEPCNRQGPFFRLCVHQRDWLAGIAIEENIVESIKNSRKTILVLSRKFTKSGWCDIETQMAKLRSFEEGQDIIVIIMLEPVPAAELTGTLRTLVRRLNYLEWPTEEEEQTLFWQKLRRALRKGGPVLPQCQCGRSFPQ